jgi:hypothetical protein
MKNLKKSRPLQIVWKLSKYCLPNSIQLKVKNFVNQVTSNQVGANFDSLAYAYNPDSAVPRQQRNTALNDGMNDYPPTRAQFSFDYLAGLVRWLAKSDYWVMSYDDLSHPIKHGEEFKEFSEWTNSAQQDSKKAVLLQYDMDARPDVTIELMKTHIECRVPGNAMVFRRKIFDWKLRQEGVVEIDTTYFADFEIMQNFESIGGVIGYHCNAFDQAGGDVARALEIFREDVTELRKHVTIKYFSMHGGYVDGQGDCNATLPVAELAQELDLIWVHNGHSVYFHSNWSDGGLSHESYQLESGDPLDFILSTNVGERTRLLFHPQNYNDYSNSVFDFPVLWDQRWVVEARSAVRKKNFNGEKFWNERYNAAKNNISDYDRLFYSNEKEQPIFINGMSRSGTTLLASIFDVHREGAMAYESYPNYLTEPSDQGVLTAEEYIFVYQTLINNSEQEAFRRLNRAPLRNLMTFVAVSNWTGMSTHQIGELMRSYLVKHHRVGGPLEALKIVAASARFKKIEQKSNFWGTKCQGNFDDYFSLWPEARLVYILRNGLDILASQKTNGEFNPDPQKLGRSWAAQYQNFHNYRSKHKERTIELVQYEALVDDTESVLKSLCEKFSLEFDPQMLRQHEVRTTLAKNPRGQLSATRVQQPIDKSSISKWRDILTADEISLFVQGAGGVEIFKKHGMDF